MIAAILILWLGALAVLVLLAERNAKSDEQIAFEIEEDLAK